ncbi:MAG: GNAT family N-acetyltransferase [Dehalococcoides mccartyi]|uniref:GNAT family N-acetyltransferase n=1 Tax=Dehalococcoides TaxID=61434 RepID=UPI0019F27B11|nr:GNAT family N-acetyltransferase [Dehalococcoides mccartyi]MBF4483045.1 GNAT family N-acetyltransferase [Dehalococcoides mccartyi]MBJ7531955.1 GNAT family N-acetyltransferase [Dehalococcoides mccartyi]MDP4280337.1 GNAT family N-acetyltransferase [Dehalococcoides mccartyi]
MEEIPLQYLYKLNKTDIPKAAEVCARAFQNDPVIREIAKEKASPDALYQIFEYILKSQMENGQAYASSANLEGIALWEPNDVRKPLGQRLRHLYYLFQIRSQLPLLNEISRIDKVSQNLRVKYAPPVYFYLALLAVDPKYQGNGIAGHLIRPMLDFMNETGIPCYLETQSSQNVAMYEHMGFKLLASQGLPGTEQIIYGMLKNPDGKVS